jgi:glycosyltransferase involved in cell wall biosynthesis
MAVMKISVLSMYWNEPQGGGINAYVMGLVEMLRRRHPDSPVDVLFVEGNGDPEGRIRAGIFGEIFGTASRLRRLSPDVIHVHDSIGLLLGAALYRSIWGRGTVVYTFLTEVKRPARLDARFFRLFGRYLYCLGLGRCSCVTFVSRDLQRKIDAVYGIAIEQPVAITYPGVEARPVSPEKIACFEKQFGISGDDIVLLSQGVTINRFKAEGTKELIAAVKRLRDDYPGIKLVLTRNGRYRPDLERYARAIEAADAVGFTGDVDDPFVTLARADLYCHITLADGLPIALLEAMAMAKPIVASRTGGIPEAIADGEDGLLVEPRSGAIVAAIRRVLSDPAFAQDLGRHARKKSQERFGWADRSDVVTGIYTSLNAR